MARKARVEIEGGLYHLITRGNDRQTIFHCDEDHAKFLSLLSAQKERLPFFLYAFCLMSNHVHLLIEWKADTIGRIMHRLLTGYSQYYNRRYKKTEVMRCHVCDSAILAKYNFSTWSRA
ncbi:MAG: transposase [Pyrinomonadaceae bacterium]